MGTPTPGPGQFSKRTDKAVANANRNLPDAGYGEQAAYQEVSQNLPQVQGADVQGMNFNDLFGNAANNVVPLDAESSMPDVPVTDGANAGPGSDASILSSSNEQKNYMASYLLPLEFMANQPGSSDAARNLVRILKSKL